MPRLSAWLVRTALGFLAAGFTVGAVLLAGRGLGGGAWLSRLLPVHVEFLLIGWTLQLVLGVVYWILPLLRTGAERGNEAIAWMAYGTLNAGVLVTAIGAAFAAPASVGVAGRALESVAAGAIALQAWPRIRPARERA